MTRDFNKQQRNDSRPPFRNSSSSNNNNRDERTPRPSRPRLNREVVDRAWESGAPQRHADYRPRDNSRQGGQYNRSPRSSQGGPYGNTRNSQGGQQGQHSPRNSYDNTRYDNKPRVNNHDSDYSPRRDRDDRGFQDRRQGNGNYQGPRDTRGNSRDDYRSNRNESSSRFSHDDRRRQDNGRNSYGNDSQHFNRRDDYRERDGGSSGSNSNRRYESRGYSQRPSQGRYQGRDERPYENHNSDRRTSHQPSFENPQAQFEGDYESFNESRAYRQSDERPSRPPRSDERPFRGSPKSPNRPNTRERRETGNQRDERPRERHVTPLPDGRVIKGPRPAQRRNARFWTEVAEETNELVNNVTPTAQSELNDTKPDTTPQGTSETVEVSGVSDVPESAVEVSNNTSENEFHEQEQNTENASTTLTSGDEAIYEATREAIRRRTRAASAVVREKKEKAVRSDATNAKPSRRGFKWPTQ